MNQIGKHWKIGVFMLATLMCLFIGLESTAYATENKEVSVYNEENKETTENKKEEERIFNIRVSNILYKFSESKMNSNLPFICYSTDRVIMDKQPSDLGLTFAIKALEVTAPFNGVQFIGSSDTIRINADMEYVFAFSNSNVVIDSNIEKSIVVWANQGVTITENAVIKGDIIVFSDTLELKGQVQGNVLGNLNHINILESGKVGKDLRAKTQKIEVANNDCISGNIVLETTNSELNIKDTFPNAVINLVDNTKNNYNVVNIVDIVMNAIITGMLFSIVFLIMKRTKQKDFFNKAIEKVKKHSLYTILMGSLTYITIPFFAIIFLLLIAIGLHQIMIPITVVYVAYLIIVSMLSIFIVGSTMFEYIKGRYLNGKINTSDFAGSLATYISLYLLTKIPVVGIYISFTILIFASGIILTMLWKKQDKKK